MSLFKRLFGKPATTSDPALLRRQLLDTAATGDRRQLLALCTANRASILQEFPHWANIRAYPDIDPQNRQQLQHVVNGLGIIAELFRDQLHEPALWNLLTRPGDNPMERFDKILAEAKTHLNRMQFQDAIQLLTGQLIDTKGISGPGAEVFRSYAHGMLGHAFFQTCRASDATEHYRQALSLCQSQNDSEGIATYLSCLYQAQRYAGQSAQAAEFAKRLAEFHAGKHEEKRWRKLAAIASAGEPLLRMNIKIGDTVLELDEVDQTQGKLTFYFERNRPTLAPSTALMKKSHESFAAGKPEAALDFCRQAAAADPFDPDPHHKAGMLLLMLSRYAEALEEYAKVTDLAPGWFNVGTDTWLAAELLAGRLQQRDYVTLWYIEDSPATPTEKLRLADELLARHPTLPHAHFLRALQLQSLNRPDDARTALHTALTHNPEPDIHSRILAQLVTLSEKPDHRPLYEKILAIRHANLMSRALALYGLKQP